MVVGGAPSYLPFSAVIPVTTEGSWAHLRPWGPMDLLVSNPPYVFHQDMEQLAPEIRRCRVGWDGVGRASLRASGMGLPWRTTVGVGEGWRRG